MIILTWYSIRNYFQHDKEIEQTNETIDSLTNEIILRDVIIIDSLQSEIQSKEQIIGSYEYMWEVLSNKHPHIAEKIEKETE